MRLATLFCRTRLMARAFWGVYQAATYLKSVRVRTMAFVYEGRGRVQAREDLPLAMGDEDARRACKGCRDKVAANILALRDTNVDHACRRA